MADTAPDETPPPAPPPPVEPAAPPPAATVVANAEITEETERLRRERDELAARNRALETEIATTQKTFQDYRATVEVPKPTKERKTRSFGFFTEEMD